MTQTSIFSRKLVKLMDFEIGEKHYVYNAKLEKPDKT